MCWIYFIATVNIKNVIDVDAVVISEDKGILLPCQIEVEIIGLWAPNVSLFESDNTWEGVWRSSVCYQPDVKLGEMACSC